MSGNGRRVLFPANDGSERSRKRRERVAVGSGKWNEVLRRLAGPVEHE
jgi:hypothetical protein